MSSPESENTTNQTEESTTGDASAKAEDLSREEFLENARPAEVLNSLREEQPDFAPDQLDSSSSKQAAGQITYLFDSDSFLNFEPLTGKLPREPSETDSNREKLITGVGTINGRSVAAIVFPASDSTGLVPGSGQQAKRLIDRARHYRVPLFLFVNSGGLDAGQSLAELEGWGETFEAVLEARKVLPVVSMFFSEARNVGSLLSPLSDFVLGVESVKFNPDSFGQGSGERPAPAATTENYFDIAAENEEKLLDRAIELLNFLPDNRQESPFVLAGESPALSTPLEELVPADKSKPYEIRKVIRGLFDANSFLEIQPEYGQNMVTGFVRLQGQAVGVVANQPAQLAGSLTPTAARKASRFVNWLDKFNMPLIRLVDLPGLMDDEMTEIVPLSCFGELMEALNDFSSPILTVILRKTYNLSFPLLARRREPTDLILAWPGAELAAADFESAQTEADSTELYQCGDPWEAAHQGLIDDVIYPRETRDKLTEFLSLRELPVD